MEREGREEREASEQLEAKKEPPNLHQTNPNIEGTQDSIHILPNPTPTKPKIQPNSFSRPSPDLHQESLNPNMNSHLTPHQNSETLIAFESQESQTFHLSAAPTQQKAIHQSEDNINQGNHRSEQMKEPENINRISYKDALFPIVQQQQQVSKQEDPLNSKSLSVENINILREIEEANKRKQPEETEPHPRLTIPSNIVKECSKK